MSETNYFHSYDNYFWQWEENMGVIAIPKESTIAYREFVMSMIDRLTDQGLPPFGSLLLAIIATNPNGSRSLDAVNEILKDSLKNESNTVLADAISFLKLVSEVPENYKKGKKRILLLMALFQNCHNMLSVRESKTVRDIYIANKRSTGYFFNNGFSYGTFSRDFRTLGLLASRFRSVDEIIKKIASLPDIPEEEIQLEEANIEQIESTDLIDQLENNYKTFHVGSLIKRIWSGLNIPVHSALPSQQPIGGISDLTNKGDFDKLLISEFANEDIVFLSRLANNEALYIHREIPPTNNNLQRVILIDVSLRNWGTPKTLAYATMIAIAKHPKTNIDCTAFAVGKTFHPISFDNVDSVIDALQILDGSPHAADGMEAFFKEYPENKNREIFIITEPSTLKQVPMLKAMNNYHANIHYWVYTDSEGNIDIYKKQQNSKKHIQHMLLPIEEIWSKQKIKQAPRRERQENSANFPILFRTSLSTKKTMSTSDGEVFQITNNKTLMRFYDKSAKQYEKGWEIIRTDLPFSHGEFEMGLASNGHHILLMFNPQTKDVNLLNLDTDETITVKFTEWRSGHVPSFFFHENSFLHTNRLGSYSIAMNGSITADEYFHDDLRMAREAELSALSMSYNSHSSIFKNIHTVFINDNNNLVFNIHELYMNQGYHIKLDSRGFVTKKISAVKNDNQFTFNDGSTIEVNSNGLLILKSSNTSIPTIYVPSVIDFSLGVSTETEFAGNMFFYKEPKFDLKLINPGPETLKIVKIVKESTEIGLKEAHELVNSWPCILLKSISRTKCQKLHGTLKQNKAEVEMYINAPVDTEEIKHITPNDFYKKHIQAYINTIITNAT